jgi:glyoxylase-like metal-dependent hydrolase (beta-lactamase superfamily II)
VRAVALHTDVIVFVSDMWQTTSTAVRSGEEGFLIDSPLFPEELRALPDVLEQAEYPVSGLLATHGDWDHLLGRLAYPGAALGAAESTVRRINAELGEAQRELRSFDEENYVTDRGPLQLGSLQSLPTPGRVELGADRELQMYPADGHTADGAAYWLPWANVLVCGDYISPVEIPTLSPGGSVEAYRQTLARLAGLVAQAEWVIPGHGAPVAGRRAQEVLAEDDAYLERLAHDPSATELPAGRTTAAQRQIHAANVAAVTGGERVSPD